MPIDKPTAEALAVVAIASRPAGATRWDAAGILAALRKVHHLEAGEVAATVVRAACDPSLNTQHVECLLLARLCCRQGLYRESRCCWLYRDQGYIQGILQTK